jgi:tRNA pseudouridine55 synthase
LDPFATGLLLLLIGRGTKLFPMLSCLDKVYEGVLLLGTERMTGDPTGPVTSVSRTDHITEGDVRRVADALEGEHEQVPPMTSAVKHRGRPLYKLDRRGIQVMREPRRIRIERFEVLSFENPRVSFRTQCSKGTYVRSLALDFGRELGVGGHLVSLRRSAIGGFSVSAAVESGSLRNQEPRELLARYGLSLSEALGSLSAVRLSPSGVRKVRCGVYPTPADLIDFDAVPRKDELIQLLDPAGDLVAVGRSSVPRGGGVPSTRIELVRVI